MTWDGPERRCRTLTDEDLAAIIERMNTDRPLPLASEIHQEHHEFIGAWIQREKRKQELWEKVKAQVFGWGVIAALGGIAYAVYEWARNHLK